MMMSLAPFEGWLAEQMETNGIDSATRLAGELRLSVERVADWTVGQGLPDPHECRRLSIYFGTPVTEVQRHIGLDAWGLPFRPRRS